MPVLREQDFDKMATRVVDQFLSGKAKLAEAAAAQAMESGLNPDQIERLAQAANTMTFLRMMDDRKTAGAGDLTHEFDPIDARQVIKIVIDNAGVHVEPGPGVDVRPRDGSGIEEHSLPDEMSALRGDHPPAAPSPPAEAKTETTDEDAPKKKETPKEAAFRHARLRKLAGVLEDEFHQASWAFEDASTKLAACFQRIYNDTSFAAFEKDALAEHGDAVGVQILNMLRVERKLAPLDRDGAFEKAASLQTHHISDDTPELCLFETLVKIATNADRLRRGLDLVRARCA